MNKTAIILTIFIITGCHVLKQAPLKEIGLLDLSANCSLYFADSLVAMDFYEKQNVLSVYVVKKEGVSLLRQSLVEQDYSLKSDLILNSMTNDSASYTFENLYSEDLGYFIKEYYHSNNYYTFFRAKNQIDLFLVKSDVDHKIEWKCKIAGESDYFTNASIYFKDLDNDSIEELFILNKYHSGREELVTVKVFKLNE